MEGPLISDRTGRYLIQKKGPSDRLALVGSHICTRSDSDF